MAITSGFPSRAVKVLSPTLMFKATAGAPWDVAQGVAENALMELLLAVPFGLAIGAVVLVTIPALWILRGGARRHASQLNNEGLRRRPCTSTRGRLNPETTR